MRRYHCYLAAVCLLLLAVCMPESGIFSEPGPVQGTGGAKPAEGGNEPIADSVNRRPIELSVGGRVWPEGGPPVYMSLHGQLMVPVSMVPEAFSAAAHYYDHSRLVIEKNTIRIEMHAGESRMLVNGRTVELKEALTEREGVPYVPLEAIEKGLCYLGTWEGERNAMVMNALVPAFPALPGAYDCRSEGRVPPVKNQGTLGTCWSFASLLALESSLLPEESHDFSEDHMTQKNSYSLSQDQGGEYTMSMAYLLAWQGPVPEADDPYGDGYSPDGLRPVKHVQEIRILPEKDYAAIKRAVYLYGGVQSSLYTSLKNYKSQSVYYNRPHNAYCYVGPEKANHDVVIVGWDDGYPRENFNMELEGDGAFICMNSWGDDFGDDGYFYVSYYDSNIGVHNILYSGVEQTDNYDHIYQTDLCGWIGQLGYGEESAYMANVYQAGKGEALKAAGFYATAPGAGYELYLARNVSGSEDFSGKELVAKGTLDNAGYYTIPLREQKELGDGERFAVIVRITTPGTIHPVAIEYDSGDGKAQVDLGDGEGYISLHGANWERVETGQGCNICLKAYTIDR